MNAAAPDFNPALSAALRWTGLGLALLAGVLALAFAAAAAVVIGLVVLAAAVTLRLTPKPKAAGPELLDAHRTPTGWEVETRARS